MTKVFLQPRSDLHLSRFPRTRSYTPPPPHRNAGSSTRATAGHNGSTGSDGRLFQAEGRGCRRGFGNLSGF